MKRQLLAVITSNYANSTPTMTRSITDLPYYKGVDESHLHIVDSQNTKRKFLLKLEKQEKDRIAVDKRRNMSKTVAKPTELKPIKLPKFVERGPSDVLR